jgi:outer membrane protein OmpA-like peptidoglycan-associated protein
MKHFSTPLTLCYLYSASLTCLMLAGCSTPPAPPPQPTSYVVLLNNDDGTVGKIEVTGRHGTTVLQAAREATLVAQAGRSGFVASEAQIGKDFGPALAIRPQRPTNFVLYFQSGGAKLTPESQRELARVLAEVESRDVPDISIAGHTDTAGDADQNEKLALERAKLVSTLLSSPKLTPANVTIESHGEKNLLVPTPDNTAEPRNRRVEITVR